MSNQLHNHTSTRSFLPLATGVSTRPENPRCHVLAPCAQDRFPCWRSHGWRKATAASVHSMSDMNTYSHQGLNLINDINIHVCITHHKRLPPFVVIIVVSGPTNTACHCRQSCFSGRRKSCLEQSATRRHISFDSRCFPKAPRNISVLTFIHCLILIHLYTV